MAPQYFFAFDMLNKLEIMQDVKILEVCEWGSHLYGTNTNKSDHDIVAIFDTDKEIHDVIQSKDYPNLFDYGFHKDLHIISKVTFQRLLNEHDMMAMELYHYKNNHLHEHFTFTLDLDTLRRKISAVCGNSWSKARKKLEIPEEDDYIALKSLFHSIRMLCYGIDLAKTGTINHSMCYDKTCKELWSQIQEQYNSGWKWEDFKKFYKGKHNSLATEFRLVAPKID